MSQAMTRSAPGTAAERLTDPELARRIAAAAGEPAAAEEAELCRRYGRRLLAFGRRRLGSADRARDLAQDTLLLTLEKLRAGEVRELDRIGAFILGVARSLSRRHWSRDGRAESLDDVSAELIATSLAPRDPIARTRVAPCVEALPEKQRAVVLLSFYAEQSSGEVADSLGLTPNHVRVLRHRGVSRLRDCLGVAQEGGVA